MQPYQRALLNQRIAMAFLFAATCLAAWPVVAVIGVIVVRGIGALSWEFLTTMPSKGMRAGGIFPAIIGTLELVGLTIIFALSNLPIMIWMLYSYLKEIPREILEAGGSGRSVVGSVYRDEKWNAEGSGDERGGVRELGGDLGVHVQSEGREGAGAGTKRGQGREVPFV